LGSYYKPSYNNTPSTADQLGLGQDQLSLPSLGVWVPASAGKARAGMVVKRLCLHSY